VPADGHYPHQAPIDAYGDGGFRFAGMSHRGSLLCLPTGMHAWAAREPADVTPANLAPIFALTSAIRVVLVGLGPSGGLLSIELRRLLRERGLIVEATSTGAALRTYNVLVGEGRAVAAALLAVESAR
jgi:uncharacterized protein